MELEGRERKTGSATENAAKGFDVTGQSVYTNTPGSGDIKKLMTERHVNHYKRLATIYKFMQQGTPISVEVTDSRSAEFKQLVAFQGRLSIDRDGVLRPTCGRDAERSSLRSAPSNGDSKSSGQPTAWDMVV